MRLVEIDIRRLPGITSPFRLGADEVGASVTLIHGPNGAGKSSLVRAITALLWPELEPAREVDLAARFELDGRNYSVERHADHVAWTIDGEPAAAPYLPPNHLASCYVITGDELLSGGDASALEAKDGALAAEIARQMSGGFDLQRLRDGTATGTRANQNAATQLRTAKTALRETQDKHKQLDEDRERLADLREGELAAEAAVLRVAELETALQLHAARETARAREEELRVFPAGLEELRGDELDRLHEIDQRLALERRAIEEADEESKRCREAIERAALPADGVSAGTLAELSQRVDRIHRGETELARLVREESIAREALEARRRALHPAATPRVDAAALARAEEWLRRADALQRRSEVLAREQATALGESESYAGAHAAGDLRDNAEATRLLTEWLSVPERASRATDVEHWLLIVAVAVASIALGLYVHAGWFALLAIAAIAVVRRARAQTGSGRRELESAFARSKSAAPAGWTREAVLTRLSELNRECAAIEAARQSEARVEELARRSAQLRAEASTADGERRRIASELGLEIASSDLALTVLARNVLEYLQSSVAHARSQASLNTQRAAHEGEVRALVDALAAFGPVTGSDAPALSGMLTMLTKRAEAHSTASMRLQGTTAARDRSLRRAETIEAEREKLLHATGDERELARRIDALPAWTAVRGAAEEAQRDERLLRRKLEGAPEWIDAPRAEIARQLDEAKRAAAERDECIRRIQHIETSIEALEKQHGLEDALAGVQAAKDALDERRENALDDAATACLLASVESATEHTAQSPVFQRAAASFARFTNHAYELQISGGRAGEPPAFRALDTARGQKLALHELSSGTRAQLLLAARIGFVAESEHGTTLPLFLDEALANSDPQRFEHIARSLSLLAQEEGRQIVYLTSDPADAISWRQAARDVDLAEIDLGEVRRISREAGVLTPMRPPPRAVPSPDGMSAEEYARALRVPAIDPFGSLDGLHLYYVLFDDLALLHRLAVLRIETIGSLRSFAHGSQSQSYVNHDEVSRVESWAAVYETIVQAWRIGRSRRIGREVLEDADVSERYLPHLAAMLDEADGDPRRLLEKLELRDDERLKNWREQKTSQLEAHLIECGYLDRRERLSADEIVQRALSVAAASASAGHVDPAVVVERTGWLCALLDGPVTVAR